jgi:hypothetical protein
MAPLSKHDDYLMRDDLVQWAEYQSWLFAGYYLLSLPATEYRELYNVLLLIDWYSLTTISWQC